MRERASLALFGQVSELQLPQDTFTAEDSAWRARAIYEPFLTAHPLPPRGVAIDIGAAHGAFAVPFARAHPGWTIWCFEPEADAFAALRANAARWGLTNLRAVNAAVEGLPLRRLPRGVPDEAALRRASVPRPFRQHREKRGYLEPDPGEAHADLQPVTHPTVPAALLARLAPNLLKLTAPGAEAGILAALGPCESLTHVTGETWRYVPSALLRHPQGWREVHLPLAGTPFRHAQTRDAAPRRPGLDVVVAMYNSAGFIRDCIDPLIAQDCPDLRVLVVDDGSTDGCGALVARAYRGHPRVRLLSKVNGGCASARNFGRLRSDAAHIAFVDADDRTDPDFFPTLLELARQTGAEAVQGGFATWDPTDTVTPLRDSYETALHAHDMRHTLGPYRVAYLQGSALIEGQPTIWRRVYRRDFLDARRIWFPEHLRAFDDQIFQLLVLQYAGSVPAVDGPRYHYRQHPGQDIRTGDERHFATLEMYRMVIRRGLAEGWNDLGPVMRSFRNTVGWVSGQLRPGLAPLFLDGAAELWVWTRKALGPGHFVDAGVERFPAGFAPRVQAIEARLAGLGDSYAFAWLDSPMMQVNEVRLMTREGVDGEAEMARAG